MKFINFKIKVQLGTITEFSKFEFYKCKHNILRALLLGIGDNNDSVNFSSSVNLTDSVKLTDLVGHVHT